MKKGILALLLVMLLGIVNVKAISENDLLAKFKQGYEVGGTVVKASSYQVSEAERYLKKYEVSDADATFISNKIDEVYELAKADKAKSFTELSDANKAKIVSIVAEISNKTSVKATLTNNGILTIYESDGKTIFTQIKDADITKQTGSNNVMFIVAGVVSILGAFYIVKKAGKANA